ncbi:hypothetical protein K8T06_01315 [bacterium]|nr:hypothetical protein [bacterium]
MASNAQQKKRTRRKKIAKSGKTRKRLIRTTGTTPKFAIHTDKPSKRAVDISLLKLNEEE